MTAPAAAPQGAAASAARDEGSALIPVAVLAQYGIQASRQAEPVPGR